MQQIVSITRQGQITLPASIRRLFNLDKYKKALVKAESSRIIIEPIEDITTLAGILKERAIKGKKIREIIQLEEKVIEKICK